MLTNGRIDNIKMMLRTKLRVWEREMLDELADQAKHANNLSELFSILLAENDRLKAEIAPLTTQKQ